MISYNNVILNFIDMKIHIKTLFLLLSFLTGSFPLTSCNTEEKTSSEFRGLWLHTGLFSLDEDRAKIQIDSLFDMYKEVGINNLFCYNAMKSENDFSWDYLQTLIDKGHARGIKIHPIFYPGYTINLEKEKAKNPEWLIRDMEGNYLPHLNLANPEVRDFWVNRIKEAMKYDIDGIHLDYIRFPTTQVYSYDSLTCSAFKNEYGYSPIEVYHDCGSMIWCEWIKWNSRQVTLLVSEISRAVKSSGKKLLLGADVFPDLETAKILIAQDWGQWAQSGLVDFICPMTYTNNLELLKEYIQNAKYASQNKCQVYPGIGVLSAHNKITKELIVKEVLLTRELGTKGMVFFSGNSFNKEMRDTLKVSVF